MQYSHLSASGERRDMDTPNTVFIIFPSPGQTVEQLSFQTPFQSHQSIGQALGPHMANQPPYTRQDSYNHRISPQSQSPPTQLTFVNTPVAGPSSAGAAAKRKQPQSDSLLNGHVSKRRRELEESPTTAITTESYDDSSGSGAKHWTDEEKTLLFQWLMAPAHDDHWNALRATKNSCLRECAVEVFANKKTYQALKGCYERNFNLFKQIYAFETFHQQAGTGPMNLQGEGERVREYERRLGLARRGGCDVGNISARVVDHWHRIGWYELFFRRYDDVSVLTTPTSHEARWNGDPVAVARTLPSRGTTNGIGEEGDVDDDQTLDYSSSPHPQPPQPILHQHIQQQQQYVSYVSPHQTLRDPPPTQPPTSTLRSSPPPLAPPVQTPNPPPIVPAAASEQVIMTVPVTQGLMSAYLQLLQMQTQTGKQKLEYLRRREEREEKDSLHRRETERLRSEREKAEFEHNKQTANIKARADRAIEVLGSPMLDASLKQAAGDYLKKLFSEG
ncbi:hypothetical protein MIND_00225400 [Mycena indigotica]|uniref:Uncharacterized protein n=1 Tax=Mycena indigotica TaxID=2126181 RepID=A0A8H6TA41_9AGAR|nr:uncharacterized protein MIND_00225400 [Mycena indigotica]KAF7312130.1 hypothetical protein MIND_00225400 [Mycena indigotica]